MGSSRVVIVGSGGHAREVLGVLRAVIERGDELDFAGFIADDEPNSDLLGRVNARWLGTVEGCLEGLTGANFLVGIGDPRTRARIAEQCEHAGLRALTLIHPSASMGQDVLIGEGSVIFDQVSITTNVRLGRHVHVNRNSTVGHDVRIGDFVTVNPLVAISGNVIIDEGAQLGTHAAILQGLHVECGAFVGAGACVTKNVLSETTVIGVPAKPVA